MCEEDFSRRDKIYFNYFYASNVSGIFDCGDTLLPGEKKKDDYVKRDDVKEKWCSNK